MPNETELSASEGLALVAKTRREAATRMIPPRWYHPAVGIAMGLIVGNAGRDSSQIFGGLGLLLLLFTMFTYQQRTGTWPAMKHKGSVRTNWLMAGGLALLVGMIGLAAWLEYVDGLRHAILWGGIAVGLVSTLFGYVWEFTFRRDEGVLA